MMIIIWKVRNNNYRIPKLNPLTSLEIHFQLITCFYVISAHVSGAHLTGVKVDWVYDLYRYVVEH